MAKEISNRWCIKPSDIHGEGVFTTTNVPMWTVIDKAIDHTNQQKLPVITFFGSKINHSKSPSTRLIESNRTWWIQAIRDMKEDEEITADYNKTPWFIAKPEPNWN